MAALEFRSLDEALLEVDRSEQHGILPRIAATGSRAYAHLLEGDAQALYQFAREHRLSEELKQIVEGRSVAVVAPAPGVELNGTEIDEFGVVLRLNPPGLRPPDEFARHGTHTHVASFNRPAVLQRRTRPEAWAPPPTLRLALCRGVILPQGPRRFTSVHRPVLLEPSTYLDAYLNHLQHALAQVLAQGPSRVKVFNANFFLAEDTHEPTYKGRRSIPTVHQIHAEQLDTGHWFARTLWKNGLVEFCPEGRATLELTTQEYLRRMEQVFRRERAAAGPSGILA